MMRSRVPNHIQAVPKSASERALRIRTVANPAGSVVPGARTSTQPERGGRVGGQTDKAAGSWVASSRRYVLPAVCPSPSLSAPVGSSGLAIRSPLWKAPQPPGSGFHTEMSPSGQRQWMRGDLGNQPPCALQGRDCWLTASCGP